MTTEQAYETSLNEGDHLHRTPRHDSATPLSKRDYIRGRLLLMVAKNAVHRAEHEGPEQTANASPVQRDPSALCRLLG